MIGDDEVRERFGVIATLATTTGHVTILESETVVKVMATNGPSSTTTPLTPYEARKLASALRRIAWRVEARQ